MTKDELSRLGFVDDDGSGILRAPIGSVVTLKLIGHSYYELKIAIGVNMLSCVIPQIALKATAPAIDVDALISGTPPRRAA